MPSQVDIANYALEVIGEDPIVSFNDEGDPKSALIDRMYIRAVRDVQTFYPWRELRERAVLAVDAAVPTWGYSKQYRVPSALNRIIDIYQSEDFPLKEWEWEGDFILTNQDTQIFIWYTTIKEDPNSWSQSLEMAVSRYLAKLIARKLTTSNEVKREAHAEFEQAMELAAQTNSVQGRDPVINPRGEFTHARWGGIGLT
jgi:hypothetical protein